MAGSYRLYRRARGYAPRPIRLPDSFANSPDLLAMGGELKNPFCLLKDQQAVLSQHMGDLENYATYEDYQKNLRLYQQLYQHQAEAIVVDKHPEYLSTKLGKAIAKEQGIPLIEVQHHHAHIAACLAENQQPLSGKAVLGIALDGLGYGDDNSLWGGEFLLADYYQSKRLACLRPAPLIGGSQAMREPWRNTYAQLYESQLWDEILQNHSDTAIVDLLKQKPLNTFNRMIEQNINCPAASSCGHLFDAVAAAIVICPEAISYEGQAAIVDARGELALESTIKTDCQPLSGLVAEMLKVCPDIHCMRDAIRGVVATVLNEFASSSNIGIRIEQNKIPIRDEVRGICEILGLDPLYLANEGKLLAIVPADIADDLLAVMQQHQAGKQSCIIGEVCESPQGKVILSTGFGGDRMIDMLVGEQLPRIC